MFRHAALGLAMTLGMGLATPTLADGDAAAGKKVFRKCMACHQLKEGVNRVGPSLHGVIRREAGAVDGFKYSDAMKGSGVTWTQENLDAYLENPRKFVKGTRMAFAGLKKEQDRLDVIAYIAEQSN